MYLTKDPCAQCVNIKDCTYRGRYVSSLFRLTEFLVKNKSDVEWYGTLRATCDYFVKDLNTCEHETCDK